MALIDNMEITAEQIAKEGLDALDDKYQKSVGFFAWDYFVAIGKIIYKLWEKLIYVSRCLTDLSNMNYDDLVKFIFQTRGITAKKATFASGNLTVTNGNGTINKGTIFETPDGLQFQAIETKEVNCGEAFLVECLVKGIEGNVPKGLINVIPTTIQGIVSVTNEEAFTNGYEDESKEDLLQRYYDDIQKPVTSGNIYHYIKWALEVTGVGNAKVKPLWNGDNTVKVVILDSNKNIPSPDLIKAVQDYIDPDSKGLGLGQAPIGAYCTVCGAIPKKLKIQNKIKLKSGIEKAEVINNIRTAIEEYLKTAAFDESVKYISYSRIGSLIMNAEGVYDYDSKDFLVNDDIDNIVLLDNDEITEVAVLDELIIEVENDTEVIT